MPNLPIKALALTLLMILTVPATQAFSGQSTQIPKGLYENRTCEQLYQAASQMESNALNYESDIYNDRNNQVASIVSTVFTPALFFLGFSNYMSFKSEHEAYQANQKLTDIRQRLAEMRCFTH